MEETTGLRSGNTDVFGANLLFSVATLIRSGNTDVFGPNVLFGFCFSKQYALCESQHATFHRDDVNKNNNFFFGDDKM